MNSLNDPPIAELLARLHREADEQRDQIRTQLSASDDQPRGPASLDGGPAAYLDVLHLLEPRLRLGAVVIADNIDGLDDDPHPYAAWVRDPANGFASSSIALKGGTEYSVRTG